MYFPLRELSVGVIRFPKVILGVGAADQVASEVKKLTGGRSVFLATDEIIGEIHGGKVKDLLEDGGFDVVMYDKCASAGKGGPSASSYQNMADAMRAESVDVVVGLGGGSVLDQTKFVSVMYTNPGTVVEFMKGEKNMVTPGLPKITMPTTSGTGSETNDYPSVVHYETGGYAAQLHAGQYHMANVSIIDPQLCMTMPRSVTAGTGLDVFSHMNFKYFTKAHSAMEPFIDTLSLGVYGMIAHNLMAAYCDGGNLEARTNMCWASALAHPAIRSPEGELIPTGDWSHVLGGSIEKYNVPHGVSVGVFLPYDLESTYLPTRPEKLAVMARAMGEKIDGLTTKEAGLKAVRAVKRLCEDMKIPTLKELSIPKKDLPEIAKAVLRRQRPGWLRHYSERELIELYERAWDGTLAHGM